MNTVKQESISHSSASQLVLKALEIAEHQGLNICACVVDVHGRVKAKLVMDNAAIVADELTERKAKTALSGLSSAEFSQAVAPLPEIFHSMVQLPQMTMLGGGLPIVKDGNIIGGFAVGGANVDQDEACAKETLAAFS